MGGLLDVTFGGGDAPPPAPVSIPDRTAPDQTRPDRTGPHPSDQTGPDGTGPDHTEPHRNGPDRTRPDQTGPDPFLNGTFPWMKQRAGCRGMEMQESGAEE